MGPPKAFGGILSTHQKVVVTSARGYSDRAASVIFVAIALIVLASLTLLAGR